MLINKICSEKVERIEKQQLENFTLAQMSRIVDAQREEDSEKVHEIMIETVSYYKDR